jgi:hypothetical protein
MTSPARACLDIQELLVIKRLKNVNQTPAAIMEPALTLLVVFLVLAYQVIMVVSVSLR